MGPRAILNATAKRKLQPLPVVQHLQHEVGCRTDRAIPSAAEVV
jgi:hypothetical protein